MSEQPPVLQMLGDPDALVCEGDVCAVGEPPKQAREQAEETARPAE